MHLEKPRTLKKAKPLLLTSAKMAKSAPINRMTTVTMDTKTRKKNTLTKIDSSIGMKAAFP